MQINPLFNAALSYAQRGWHIFPVHSIVNGQCTCGGRENCNPGKHPMTLNGFKDATTDPDVIRHWWMSFPYANIGIRTGEISNLLVVDCDGQDAILNYTRRFSAGVSNCMAFTGGGGSHVYFQSVEGISSFSGLITNVDIRCNNGFVVAAPSIHKSGTHYRWGIEPPIGQPLSVVPTLLVDAIRAKAKIAISPSQKYPNRYDGTDTEKVDEYLSTPGLLVFKNLYNMGQGYKTIAGILHRYNNGVYEALNDDSQRRLIIEYLSNHRTDQKKDNDEKSNPKHEWATPAKADESIRFVKMRTHVDIEQVNPAGLNVRNGFIQLTYSQTLQPECQLLQHDENRVCTYKADFDYNPDADPTILNAALDSMLDPPQQEILIRLIASSLDLPKVRLHQGRAVRLGLLLGKGSNGKDTFRTWMEHFFGGIGLSCVSLQSFKEADKGRSFGLAPLVNSRLNWSSENVNIGLDTCETLKVFSTGDPLMIERKHEQGFEIKPKTVGLFNMNEFPKLRTEKEAIRSRFAPISFIYTFKNYPDPKNPYEKKADPRLREDADYIKTNILPALLNRLVTALGKVLVEGIDYSVNEGMLFDLKLANSHFAQFEEALGIVQCHTDEGTPARDFFNHYHQWCIDEGYIHVDESGRLTYHDPSPSDRIIRNYRQITPRLREYYTNLSQKNTSRGSVLGVKITKPNPNPKGFRP